MIDPQLSTASPQSRKQHASEKSVCAREWKEPLAPPRDPEIPQEGTWTCSVRQHAQAVEGTSQLPRQEGRGDGSQSWWVSCTQDHQSPQQTQEGLNSRTQNRAASEKLTPFSHLAFCEVGTRVPALSTRTCRPAPRSPAPNTGWP